MNPAIAAEARTVASRLAKPVAGEARTVAARMIPSTAVRSPTPTPTPVARPDPRMAVHRMFEDEYRQHVRDTVLPGRESFNAKMQGGAAALTPQGRQYAIEQNPRFEHSDPDAAQELATRGARGRPEVAIPASGRITPAQDQELRTRLFHAPSHADMPTPMRLFEPGQFARNPERGVSNVADYRTAQHIAAARQRSQAIPQAIAPKLAGMRRALALFRASSLRS